MRCIILILLISVGFILSCVEPYQFTVENQESNLVIEGTISNKSFNDTKAYPSDGRFFQVKLSLTGNVENTKAQFVNDASVFLELSDSSRIYYDASGNDDGIFYLKREAFKAVSGMGYRLKVYFEETEYVSSWEYLPLNLDKDDIDTVTFREEVRKVIPANSLDQHIIDLDGITANTEIKANSDNKEYYRWRFIPTWIFKAAIAEEGDPNKVCWVTNQSYLSSYVMSVVDGKNFTQDLFFIETKMNEKIYYKYSVLFLKEHLNKAAYNFWDEMQKSANNDGVISAQPFNVPTNFTANKPVNGYFSVVGESAYRWYFDKSELSYYVEDDLRYNCIYYKDNGPYGATCLSCLAYPGKPINVKPSWWKD